MPKHKTIEKDHDIVIHFRTLYSNNAPHPRGGATVVYSPVLKRFGVSICNNSDQFCRKVGRTIATGRCHSERDHLGRHRFNATHSTNENLTTFGDVYIKAAEIVRKAASLVENDPLYDSLGVYVAPGDPR